MSWNKKLNGDLAKIVQSFVIAINSNPDTSNYIGFYEDTVAFETLERALKRLIVQEKREELKTFEAQSYRPGNEKRTIKLLDKILAQRIAELEKELEQ